MPLFHSPGKAQIIMATSDDLREFRVTDRYFLELYESNDADLVELILISFISVSHSFSSSVFDVLYLSGSGYEYIYMQRHCGKATILRSHHIEPRSPCRNLFEAGPQRN